MHTERKHTVYDNMRALVPIHLFEIAEDSY